MEYLCVPNDAVECVRITNLKIVNGFDTQRHLDTILIQCISRVGPINRVFIFNNPKFPDAERNNSTMAIIELLDKRKHPVLCDMIDCYRFHKQQWAATIHRHVFHGLDTEYRPKAIKCEECANYSKCLYDREREEQENKFEFNRKISMQMRFPSLTKLVNTTMPIITRSSVTELTTSSNEDDQLQSSDEESVDSFTTVRFLDHKTSPLLQNNKVLESKSITSDKEEQIDSEDPLNQSKVDQNEDVESDLYTLLEPELEINGQNPASSTTEEDNEELVEKLNQLAKIYYMPRDLDLD